MSVAFGLGSGVAQQREVAHGCQVVVQQRRSVAKVLQSVAVAQRVEYFFEELPALADARCQARLHVVRPRCAIGVYGGVLPREVNPVDGPRLVLVGGVGVGLAGRQYHVLVGGYWLLAAADAEPPVAFHVVYQHVLRYRLGALAVVACGLWVVANVGYVEA